MELTTRERRRALGRVGHQVGRVGNCTSVGQLDPDR
jgi:hypothetical protein